MILVTRGAIFVWLYAHHNSITAHVATVPVPGTTVLDLFIVLVQLYRYMYCTSVLPLHVLLSPRAAAAQQSPSRGGVGPPARRPPGRPARCLRIEISKPIRISKNASVCHFPMGNAFWDYRKHPISCAKSALRAHNGFWGICSSRGLSFYKICCSTK